MTAFETRWKQLLGAWVRLVATHALLTILACATLTAGVVVYLSENVQMNTDTTDMLSEELPFRQNERAKDTLFPQFDGTILLILEAGIPDAADEAALDLANKLRQRADVFGDVFDPAGDPFLRKNGLLFLEVDELEQLTERLAAAQPFLASLWADASLSTLFELIEKALNAERMGEGVTPEETRDDKPPLELALVLAQVLDQIAAVTEAQVVGRQKDLSWRLLMSGEGEPEKQTRPHRRFLVIKPPLDYGSLQPASKAINALRAIRNDLGWTSVEETGVRLRITGSAALKQEELKSVQEGMGIAGIVSFALVMGLLIWGLGKPSLVLATLVTLIVGLIWTGGFAIAALGSLNLLSVAFAVLFIGLSVDFGIHFVLRFREGYDQGGQAIDALAGAAEGAGGALTLCAIAAAAAFYAFLPTDYDGLAELGLIAGTGMFIALLANLTILPALIALRPPRQRPETKLEGARISETASRLEQTIKSRARPLLVVALIIGCIAGAAATQARFDFDPMNLRDPSSESVSAILSLAEGVGPSPYAGTVLVDGGEAARELIQKLEALPEVAGVSSLFSYVPTEQDEKAELVFDLSLFLLPSFEAPFKKPEINEAEAADALVGLKYELSRLNGLPDEVKAAAERLAGALSTVPPEKAVELEKRLMRFFVPQVGGLKTSLLGEPFTVVDLPKSIADRNLSGETYLLTVYPAGDLRDPEQVRDFMTAVSKLAPDISGAPAIIEAAGQAVVSAFIEAVTLALAFIFLLLIFVLKNMRDAIVVFLPLSLAAILTGATSAMLNLPFNFANIIVLPLLFGLGVASGIHLVLRERELSNNSPDDPSSVRTSTFRTSTPRAVIFSALTTIGSFSSIALSGHPGTASMGVLLGIAITFTLVCTMTILPAFFALKRGV